MLISKELNEAINAQIGRELLASNQYVNMAAFFDDLALKMLSDLFFKQADEEREHAMKFVHYLTDVGGSVAVPALAAPKAHFGSVEGALQQALDWETDITGHINALMDLAISQKDHAAQDFLRWFVTEQIEEIKSMDDLLKVARQAGDRNIYMVEAYLIHIAEAGD